MYFLATDKITVFHYGEIIAGEDVSTGQPFLFKYDTINELRAALEGFGQIYIPLTENNNEQ